MSEGRTQVIHDASKARAAERRRRALANLRERALKGRLYLPTGAKVDPREEVIARIRTARIRRAMSAENLPQPIPASTRSSALGTNGAPVTGDLADDKAFPTDPVTGAMVLPDLELPNKANAQKAYEIATHKAFRDRNGRWHDARNGRFVVAPTGKW